MREPKPELFTHPESAEDVAKVVLDARKQGRAVRVCGSAHSSERSIYTDDFSPEQATDRHPFNLMLDRMNHVALETIPDPDDPTSKITVARVGAGAWLGPDPIVAEGLERPNLIKSLRERNLALDVVGGITHQAVGGFVATGSAGASVMYDFGGALLAFDVVDGMGNVNTYRQSPKGATAAEKRNNPFYALGTSMGLLGIVTEVTLRVVPAFDVAGTVTTAPIETCGIDVFGDGNGHPTLDHFLRSRDYSRLLWWPQRNVDLVQVWECRRVEVSEQHEPHEQFDDPLLEQHLIILLYQGVLPALARGAWDDVTRSLKNLTDAAADLLAQGASEGDAVSAAIQAASTAAETARVATAAATAAGTALDALQASGAPLQAASAVARDAAGKTAEAASAAEHIVQDLTTAAQAAQERIQQLQAALAQLGTIVAKGMASNDAASAYEQVLALIIPLFMEQGVKEFNDSWWHGIPDDNQVSDKLVPVTFTELWLPLSKATEVMSALRQLYQELSPWGRGSFCVELYAGPASEFWLSAAYGNEPVFRVDVFVLEDGPEWDRRDEFYEPYWNLLSKFGARFHWGKRLSPPNSETGVEYRRATYGAQLRAFLELRENRDPGNVFLTTYWREHLGILVEPGKAAQTAAR